MSREVDESDAVASFKRLGLSKYEAEVFIALAKLNSGTASDVDRLADVPRSQVYGAAESLEERGLVEIQQSSPIRYRAVALDEARETLRERVERETARAFDYIETAREQVGDDTVERQEGVWTVTGLENVANRVQQLVGDADRNVLYVTPADLLSPDVVATLEARATAVEVWVLESEGNVASAFADDAPVSVAPFPDEPAETKGRLLAVDGDTVLLSVTGGEGVPGASDETAIWSSDTGFAAVLLELIGSYLGDEIETKL